MEPGDKALLLEDLCGRIMYGVKCSVYEDTNVYTLSGVLPNKGYNELYFEELDWKECEGFADIQYCKPYLFPISSMTEEQRIEFRKIMDIVEARCINACCKGGFTLSYTDLNDWLNKNNFDYRGLIPKGLANDATNLKIY